MTRKAFTLIELLVVIAIIAILAAILFPVFAQAKVAAKVSSSLSNIKQIGLSLHMYGSDYDDATVWEYGTTAYTSTDTWVGRVLPYVKNRQIFFDPLLNANPKEDDTDSIGQPSFRDIYYCPASGTCFYSYPWTWVSSYSLNTDGYSRTFTGTCTNMTWGSQDKRTLTSFEEPAARLAIAPTRYGTLQWSWMRFYAFDASWPIWMDRYGSDGFYWEQLVWDGRKQYPNARFNGAFADGSARKFGREKFLSRTEAPDRATYCQLMQDKDLFKFWGRPWSPD
jgi:prepilin-type N-terminal cleavage/methylation domain-containing protein